MIYWLNRILTNVKTFLGSDVADAVSASSNSLAKFPCVSVEQAINNSYADELEVSDSENAVLCGIDINVFVKTSVSNGITIIGKVNTAMYRMGFHRISGPMQIQNFESPDIIRINARYQRMIGADDTIDRFN